MADPLPPSTTPMFGRRKQQTDEAPTNDTSTVGSFSPVSRFAPAEVRWHAMMAESQAKDAEWEQSQATAVAPPKKTVIASPHRAATFRAPGAAAAATPPSSSSGPPHRGPRAAGPPMGPGPPPGAPLRATAERPGARVMARGGRSREVNSKTEAKPVAGQLNPGLVAQHRQGGAKPPPMHPAMVMRKQNGALPPQRPAPPRNRPPGQPPRPLGLPPRPPPEVLAKLRAQGPPKHSPLLAKKLQTPSALSSLSSGTRASPAKKTMAAPTLNALSSVKSVDGVGSSTDEEHALLATSKTQLPRGGAGRLAQSGQSIVSAAATSDASEVSAATAPIERGGGGAAVVETEACEDGVDAATRAMAFMEKSDPHRRDVHSDDAEVGGGAGGGGEAVAGDGAANNSSSTTTTTATCEWIRMWDEEMASNYYYNQTTGEASWIPPEDFQEPLDEDGSNGGGGGGSNAGGAEGGGGGGAWVGSEGGWERYWDDDAHAYYAHNPATGETRWVAETDARGGGAAASAAHSNANAARSHNEEEEEAPTSAHGGDDALLASVTPSAMSSSAMSSGIMATAEPKITASGKYMIGDW